MIEHYFKMSHFNSFNQLLLIMLTCTQRQHCHFLHAKSPQKDQILASEHPHLVINITISLCCLCVFRTNQSSLIEQLHY